MMGYDEGYRENERRGPRDRRPAPRRTPSRSRAPCATLVVSRADLRGGEAHLVAEHTSSEACAVPPEHVGGGKQVVAADLCTAAPR
jgi:hypothetical protein